jgi:hydroxymethylpyrimidine pyrophosphatase-like HAD family hydrolase
MRYVALATDFDGTLAHDGCVDTSTIESLKRLAASGRKLLLVTGRELDDLRRVFDGTELFDLLVVENGAVLHRPATGETRVLGAAPPPRFVAELERRGVAPLSVGASIVATWHPNEQTVLEVIRELGLELQVIFNKGAVMVLPAGVNKATGLAEALRELGLSPHNAVAIGDAENDHALLELAECSAAVANAVPMLKAKADLVTRGDHGAGVVELIDRLIGDDLRDVTIRRDDRQLLLGTRADGSRVQVATAGLNMLIAGTSGSGKSTLATGLLERLMSQRYQCCVIDPEGDYEELGDAILFGSPQNPPEIPAIFTALEQPATSVIVNLLGVKLDDRPAFFAKLLLRLHESRSRSGRPHWILVDEAHHLLPADWQPAPQLMTEGMTSMMFVTVHAEQIARALLPRLDVVAAVGDSPVERISQVAAASNEAVPSNEAVTLESGEALVWLRRSGEPPFRLRSAPSTGERRRHLRKYAEGELGADRSFYFRGPAGRLNLRAQNLVLFMQLADGVDDATWQHHLARGDYSRWIRGSIKDDELADDVQVVEEAAGRLEPAASRRDIRGAIEKRYTLPATGTAASQPNAR